MKSLHIFLAATFLFSTQSFAWGRRGHSSIAVTAAYVLGAQPDAHFLKSHSYDLGFYANVPDFFWRKPATSEQEHAQHFMDYDRFVRLMKEKEGEFKEDSFVADRAKFAAQFPNIAERDGRAPWRIQEFFDKLTGITGELEKTETPAKQHQEIQSQWLIVAGTMSHYIGDLAMPFHCSENYDGEMTNQKGIHSFFEDVLVDELYPDLEKEILADANKRWPKFHQDHAKKDPFHLALELCRDSVSKVPEALAIDKKTGRDNIPKAAKAFRSLIKARLTQGALYAAEIWSRQLGWSFDNHRFYLFDGEPVWIAPPGVTPPKSVSN